VSKITKKKDISVYDIDGNKKGKMVIPEKITQLEVSVPFLHEVVKSYLANQRKGTASTKMRSEVRGGGAKPWRQKGTGRARVGTIRSPLWRKGGVTFGPKPRSYRQDLPKKKYKLGLNMAIKSKCTDDELIILKDFTIDEPKTKKVKEILKKLNVDGKRVLLVMKEFDNNIKLASRNLGNLEIKDVASINTYDMLSVNKVIFSESAMSFLFDKRLSD
jgi:large subunit ribosomal protein L4